MSERNKSATTHVVITDTDTRSNKRKTQMWRDSNRGTSPGLTHQPAVLATWGRGAGGAGSAGCDPGKGGGDVPSSVFRILYNPRNLKCLTN